MWSPAASEGINRLSQDRRSWEHTYVVQLSSVTVSARGKVGSVIITLVHMSQPCTYFFLAIRASRVLICWAVVPIHVANNTSETLQYTESCRSCNNFLTESTALKRFREELDACSAFQELVSGHKRLEAKRKLSNESFALALLTPGSLEWRAGEEDARNKESKAARNARKKELQQQIVHAPAWKVGEMDAYQTSRRPCILCGIDSGFDAISPWVQGIKTIYRYHYHLDLSVV